MSGARAVMARLALALVVLATLTACGWPPRTAPVGTIAPHPQQPGAYVLNPELPQPDPERYQATGGGLGFLGVLAQMLPGPWGYILTALASALVGMPIARRAPMQALRQTVDGIEQAKHEHPEAVPALHAALNTTQDEATKRLVWEIRP